MPGVRTSSGTRSQASDQRVEPKDLDASGLLTGEFSDLNIPTGKQGVLDVVQTGPPITSLGILDIPVMIRNNTAEDVYQVAVTAQARDAAGNLVSTGQSFNGSTPEQVGPGELSYTSVRFEHPPASGSQVIYEINARGISQESSTQDFATMKMTESNNTGERVVGSAINQTGHRLTTPITAQVACFTSGGDLSAVVWALTDGSPDLEPEATVFFTAELERFPCEQYAVGVTAQDLSSQLG